MPASVAPHPEPASRATVFATALVIVAVLAVLLPALNPAVEVRTILFMGWIPALLGARVGWGAKLGAIRQRFLTEPEPNTIGNQQRWAIAVFNPRVLTATGTPGRYRWYMLLEMIVTGLVWLAIVGPAFGPLLRTVSVAMWGDGTE